MPDNHTTWDCDEWEVYLHFQNKCDFKKLAENEKQLAVRGAGRSLVGRVYAAVVLPACAC